MNINAALPQLLLKFSARLRV